MTIVLFNLAEQRFPRGPLQQGLPVSLCFLERGTIFGGVQRVCRILQRRSLVDLTRGLRRISALTDSKVEFGLISKDQWLQPSWINEEKASAARKDMVDHNVIYGGECIGNSRPCNEADVPCRECSVSQHVSIQLGCKCSGLTIH